MDVILNISENSILTAIYWNTTCGPHLTANW